MDDLLTVGTYFVTAVGVVWGLFFASREFIARFNSAGSEPDSWSYADLSNKAECSVPLRTATQVKAWNDVLEVSVNANQAQVKAAYRKKIELYHPDKVAGLGHELRQLAEVHTKAINAAYDMACRHRGNR
jgi:DnaJ-domain-containing protein 1